eukprot:786235_1
MAGLPKDTSLKTADSLVDNSKMQNEMITIKTSGITNGTIGMDIDGAKGEIETFYTPPLSAQSIDNEMEIETDIKMMSGMRSNTSNDSMYENGASDVIGITPQGDNNDENEDKTPVELMYMHGNESLYNPMNGQVTTQGNE